MRLTTIALIFSPDHTMFLMGQHQRGEGKGKLSFVGGKVADKPEFKDETPDQSVLREIKEEAGIIPDSIIHQADIVFDHSTDKDKEDELMKVYRIDTYKGQESENPEEFQLIWVKTDKLPLDRMWPSDRLWLPKLLANQDSFHKMTFRYSSVGDIELEQHKESAEPRQVVT